MSSNNKFKTGVSVPMLCVLAKKGPAMQAYVLARVTVP